MNPYTFAFLLSACAAPSSRKPTPDPVASCAEGELLDGDGCVPEACGVGTWGSLPVGEDTVYVDLAAPGGDGSEAAPLNSIQAAVDLAGDRDGGLVAVAAGTYVEVISMDSGHDGVTIGGRCRDLVTIDGSEGDDVPTIEIIGGRRWPEIAIEGVAVTGGTSNGMWLEWAYVNVSASDVRENTEGGIVVGWAEVTLDDVRVSDSLPDRRGDLGRGINAQVGAALTATGCTVERSTDVGVFASDEGTRVDLVDTVVLDTQPSSDGSFGRGIVVQDGAAVTATGCTVQGNTEFGVDASGVGTSVDLVDTAILETHAGSDGGLGIVARDGAAVSATGCTVQRNNRVGVRALGEGTTVQLRDSAVLDTLVGPEGDAGVGLLAQEGAALTATGCTVQGNTGLGVQASGAGTTVDLQDTDVVDNPDIGIQMSDGAALTAAGCTVQANTGAGIWAGDVGTTVDLQDTVVLDTHPGPDGGFGRGIEAESGVVLTATGCTVQANTDIGIFVEGNGTTVDLHDTLVTETRRGRTTGLALGLVAQDGGLVRATGVEVSETEGCGVYAISGGQVELERTRITGNSFAGALVLNGSMTLSGATVTDTLPDAEWGGGFGVYAGDIFGAPSLTLTDTTIGPQPYAAVWLDGRGTYDIEGNALSGSTGIERGGFTMHGNAVFAENGVTAWDGTTGLRLAGNTFDGASEVGVLLDGSSADLDGNTWADNGADLLQQRCDGVVQLTEDEPDWNPAWAVCPAGNILTDYDIEFSTISLPTVETEE